MVHSRVPVPCSSRRRRAGASAVRKWDSFSGAARVRALARWPGDVGRRPRGAGLGGVGGWGVGARRVWSGGWLGAPPLFALQQASKPPGRLLNFCARRPAPTIRLCLGSVVSGWGVWLGAAPVFGEGPLLRRRLGCTLTLEQLRSVSGRGTVPIGLQAWLGHGGPGGCRSLLTTPSIISAASCTCSS